MKFNIVSIFPEMFESLRSGIVGQAIHSQKIKFQCVNPRDFTHDVHRTVDDRPYGGGDGMVMLAEPLEAALKSLGEEAGHVVYLSPQGRLWSDSLARTWAKEFASTPLTFICGRYGGIDQRFINRYVQSEISIGDYILSGGEIAAMVVIDSLARFVPGVLGNAESPDCESFSEGFLEAPLFTRPSQLYGEEVPPVLRGGHHLRINEWRRHIGLVRTALLRPDIKLEPKILQKAVNYALALDDSELKACGLDRVQIEGLKREPRQ